MNENLHAQNELRFDYVTASVIALTLPVSVVISPRLGFSHPWLLVGAWGCYAIAAALSVLRLRGALQVQRPSFDPATAPRHEQRRDLWFRILVSVFFIGLVCNGVYLATNLYLNYLEQEQNAQIGDDGCQLHT